MDHSPGHSFSSRGDARNERERRLRRETEAIAQGHAEIDADLGIEDDALEEWLDALDHDEDAPFPAARPPLHRPYGATAGDVLVVAVFGPGQQP